MARQRVCLWHPKSSVLHPRQESLILPYLELITNIKDQRIRFLYLNTMGREGNKVRWNWTGKTIKSLIQKVYCTIVVLSLMYQYYEWKTACCRYKWRNWAKNGTRILSYSLHLLLSIYDNHLRLHHAVVVNDPQILVASTPGIYFSLMLCGCLVHLYSLGQAEAAAPIMLVWRQREKRDGRTKSWLLKLMFESS